MAGGGARQEVEPGQVPAQHALLAAHRHVFGVFFWFVLFSSLGLGPLGAVLYRMAEFAARYWTFPSKALGVPEKPSLSEHAAVGTARLAWRGIGHAN